MTCAESIADQYWTVVEVLPPINRVRWCRARCACGTERRVRLGDIKLGKSRSCGCRPALNIGRPRRDSAERFWEKVERRDDGECWPWLARTDSYGYGIFWDTDRDANVKAHRYAYELLVGPIPDGLTIDHLCRSKNCVNPRHMEPVTSSLNSARQNRALRGEACEFPLCPDAAVTERGMCDRHRLVTVSGSWVPDRHDSTSGGEH